MRVEYFSCSEIAQITGVKAATVRRWCKTGKLKASRPGGRVYIVEKSDLEAFLKSDGSKPKGA